MEFPLVGAGGEPISFARTVYSHGCARLPPARVTDDPLAYMRPFRIGKRVVNVTLEAHEHRLIAHAGARLGKRDAADVTEAIAGMFRLRENLAPFYARIAHDPRLAWATSGAGRILASPTVFEDVVKTICTTNCAWSATIRMTTALAALGGGAFPDPELLAHTPEAWYRDTARMGYRGPYVRTIAGSVVSGSLDLEGLRDPALGEERIEEALLALPGIGPYGAAHVMLLLGRHRRLVLDSWTRPKFVRLAGLKRAADSTIRRAFSRYGEFAGLAFWLYLTRDWIED